MAHAHTIIRNAVAAALTGLATTGARVYPNRIYPMDAASLPGLRIYMDADTVQTETVHTPVMQSHDLTLQVECCARAAADLDDTLDQIALEVETVLAAGVVVSGKTLSPLHAGSQFDDERGAIPAVVKRLTFTLSFYTLGNAPGTLV